MPDLNIPFTVRTVRFEIFVLSIRERTTTRDAVSLLFTYCLSSEIIFLTFVKICPNPKIPIARLATGFRTSENGHVGMDMQPLHDCSHLCVTSL